MAKKELASPSVFKNDIVALVTIIRVLVFFFIALVAIQYITKFLGIQAENNFAVLTASLLTLAIARRY